MGNESVEIIILAAGTSSRLGEPKQLLPINNQTLLSHVVTQALKLSSNVNVVLGAYYEECLETISHLPVKTIYNENYLSGMGSSIACAMKQINTTSPFLIMLCDQPLIPLSHYEKLIVSIRKNPNNITGSLYSSKTTVPAIFPNSFKSSLLTLNGEQGAKSLLKDPQTLNISLDKKYAKDIDTKEDCKEILHQL